MEWLSLTPSARGEKEAASGGREEPGRREETGNTGTRFSSVFVTDLPTISRILGRFVFLPRKDDWKITVKSLIYD